MYRLRTLVVVILALFGVGSAAAFTESATGAIHGAISDSSGGLLPGVTVVATSMGGQVLATTVTDATGTFEIAALPAGQVSLTFQLDGFTTAAATVDVRPADVSTVQQRLELSRVTETVVVVGQATVLPPKPLQPPPPVVKSVPVHDRNSICGPAKPGATPESFGTIRSRRSEADRDLYAKDEELIVDGGTLDGLEVGRNLVVRRHYRVTDAGTTPEMGEHTAGLVQIVAADEHLSRAVVIYACDELRKGDFLAAFKPEPIRTPDPVGIPAYGEAARILFADVGQMVGAPHRMMVIDRGSEHGLHVGQRVTLFRRRAHNANRAVTGDAVIVAIRGDSATIRVEEVTDVISPGDRAAPQHTPPTAPIATGAGTRQR
jgi:hypothetical protein